MNDNTAPASPKFSIAFVVPRNNNNNASSNNNHSNDHYYLTLDSPSEHTLLT